MEDIHGELGDAKLSDATEQRVPCCQVKRLLRMRCGENGRLAQG
jgi:hypothetical protein